MKDYRRISIFWYTAMIILGAVLFLLGFLFENQFLNGFGLVFALIVGIRLIRLLISTKDEESKDDYNVSVSDERVVYLTRRARSAAFYISVLAEAVAVLVLYFLDLQVAMQAVSYVLCAQVLIYVVSYYIIKAKC